MPTPFRHAVTALGFALIANAFHIGGAAAEPQSVLVNSPRAEPPPRTDVLVACPGIADMLEQELAPAVLMQGKAGTVRVEFRLQGKNAREVVSTGGPREYRGPIRSALRGLSCIPGQDGERFVLAIRFAPDLEMQAKAPQRPAQLVAP